LDLILTLQHPTPIYQGWFSRITVFTVLRWTFFFTCQVLYGLHFHLALVLTGKETVYIQ
jgi:hypothetical protein